jgi:hypothetical protein
MSAERFINARVHEWLAPTLDSATDAMHTTRILLNSAAVWWFCHRLPPEQRAEILGEYVKIQALGGVGTLPTTSSSSSTRKRGRPRKNSASG